MYVCVFFVPKMSYCILLIIHPCYHLVALQVWEISTFTHHYRSSWYLRINGF